MVLAPKIIQEALYVMQVIKRRARFQRDSGGPLELQVTLIAC
jgi:hypothetical protein